MREGYIIETERCLIREIEVSDIPDVFELYDSPHMVDFIEPLESFEVEVEYQKLYIEKIYRVYGYGMWAVFDKNTLRLIGEAGLEHRKDLNRKKFPYDWMFEEHTAELGFCFAEDLWGQGYGYEVCSAELDYAKKTFGIDTVFARADIRNTGSVALLRKLGFKDYSMGYYRMEL